MKEKIEARIKELEKLVEERQIALQQLSANHNGLLHRIDELKLLIKEPEV